MNQPRHYQRLPSHLLRVRTPCWSLDKEVVALLEKAAKKYGQTPSRIVQAAIRYKASELKGRYKGIRWAFESFKDFDEPLPAPPQPRYFTPPLFEVKEDAHEI